MSTEYKVLSKTKDGWQELTGTYLAASSRAAIQNALNSGNAVGDASGEYVAVPERSWQPVSVKVEQALKFSS